jgi:hypothetical protein
MLGALMGGAGGGMSASSSASSSLDSTNSIGMGGGMSVGGLNMGSRSMFDSDAMKIAVIGGLVIAGIYFLKKK